MSACVIEHGTDQNGPRRSEATHGQLCERHARRLYDWLEDVTVDYALLDTRIAPMKSATDYSHDTRGGGDEAAAPLNLDVVALRDSERGGAARLPGDELWFELPDIPSVLPVLHGRAEDLRCLLDPSRDRDAHDSIKDSTVGAEIRYLLSAFESLVFADWIDEMFTEIRGIWIALQRAHDRPRPKPIGKCLTVDCDGTVWPRVGTAPWCSQCHRVYDTNSEVIKVRLEVERAERAEAEAV